MAGCQACPPQPRRPPLPGPRRRRQAARPAALPGVDRPQRLRPGRHAHRGVRLDDRPARSTASTASRTATTSSSWSSSASACSRRRRRAPRSRSGSRPRSRRPCTDRRPAPRSRRSRTETDEAIVFSTTDELPIVACRSCGRAASSDRRQARTATTPTSWRSAPASSASTPCPRPATRCSSASTEAVPSCAVRLRFGCRIEGVGVDPTFPPLAWEAWTGDGWAPCEVDSDTTGGLNRDGDVDPPRAATATSPRSSTGLRAGWLRARVTEPVEGQPRYSASPEDPGAVARSPSAARAAPSTPSWCVDEVAGHGRGRARRHVRLLQAQPGRARGDAARRSRSPTSDGWQEWTQVSNFAAQRPGRPPLRCSTRSPARSRSGPAVRLADGSAARTYGAVPAEGRRHPGARLPHRRRPAGQRRARAR